VKAPLPRFISDGALPLTASNEIEHSFAMGTSVSLSAAQTHHARNVLRLNEGDHCEVLCPLTARVAVGTLASVADTECRISLLRLLPSRATPRVYLLVGAPKPAKADLIVEKAVELGVRSVCFFGAERSQAPAKSSQIATRIARLERVRDAALKQSRSPVTTVIDYQQDLATTFKLLNPSATRGEIRLICLLSGQAPTREHPTIIELFRKHTIVDKLSPPALENSDQSVESYVLVGPEGGFTSSEIELAFRYFFCAASLGQTQLRTETAAILASGTALLMSSQQSE
jgi:16S rRNA (uracil1498-N3)-methyltransferase